MQNKVLKVFSSTKIFDLNIGSGRGVLLI